MLTKITFVDVEVPVFQDYVMPCNISDPVKGSVVWFQRGKLLRAVEPFLLPRGEILFRKVSLRASGDYLCCKVKGELLTECADTIRLQVKGKCLTYEKS